MLKSNEYFDGKVKSIALETSKGPATVGVMEAGEYTFNTASKELMVVVSGEMEVKLPNEAEFKVFAEGSSFEVAENSAFDLVIKSDVAYMCYYG